MTAQTRIALRAGLGLVALLGVAACAPEIPDSGAGFTNQPPPAQSAPLGAPLPPPDAVSSEVIALLDDLKARRPNFDYEIRELNRVLPSMTDRDAPIVTTVAQAIRPDATDF